MRDFETILRPDGKNEIFNVMQGKKWSRVLENAKLGLLVIIKDMKRWNLACVANLAPSIDNLVRNVYL